MKGRSREKDLRDLEKKLQDRSGKCRTGSRKCVRVVGRLGRDLTFDSMWNPAPDYESHQLSRENRVQAPSSQWNGQIPPDH